MQIQISSLSLQETWFNSFRFQSGQKEKEEEHDFHVDFEAG